MSEKNKNKIVTILFAIIIILSFFINIIKKDEIISIAERRKLEQFPSVSISQIINGTFFNKFDKYIQAVRRERRIEKALEGSRLQDILRWAAADILIIGKTPTGALFKGSSLETAYGESLQEGENLFLTGTPSDSKRYIIPFNNKHYPNGWQFNPERDYLLPIQPRMLSLTGNQWVQNPGW